MMLLESLAHTYYIPIPLPLIGRVTGPGGFACRAEGVAVNLNEGLPV